MLAGTMVQLNERTALRASPGSATAELLRGEASVTVVPGARAFDLRFGSRRVHCAAGAVVVRVTDESVAVLVTAGAAEIRVGEKEPLRASAGTRLTIDPSGGAAVRAEQVTPAKTQEMLAWQAPRIPLADTRLADAIEQFNLYNWEQFELADRVLGERRVSGVFRADSVDEFAAYLRREHRIATERVNRTSSSDRNSPGGISLLLRSIP
jgi:ferric-dicitrate binding protein FerR (iron transport regulator)